jgi:hypothetical protein
MYKFIQDRMISQGDFNNDAELRNSIGNVFSNCVFYGNIVGINMSFCRFTSTCEMGSANFSACNFSNVNVGLTSGVNPQTAAASVLGCNFGSVGTARVLPITPPGDELGLREAQSIGQLYRPPNPLEFPAIDPVPDQMLP